MNQECVCAGLLSYSAVPVFPRRSPGRFLSWLAVPEVTTSRIIWRSASSEAGWIAGPSAATLVGAGSLTSAGCFHWPRAIAPAAPASPTGETSVVPWPNAAAACSAAEPLAETLPVNTPAPRSHGTPMPTVAAVLASPSGPSLGASEAKAVLHDLAKSTCNGTLPSSSLCEFLNVRPSTVSVFGQLTGVLTVAEPFSRTPSAVMVLNVEPGGTWPTSAKLLAATPGPLATATIWLVLTLM